MSSKEENVERELLARTEKLDKLIKENLELKTKESKADKMFEELGYEKYINGAENLEYYKYQSVLCKDDDIVIIRFYSDNKDFWCNHSTSMQELQAINEKVKELGWL